MSNVHRPDIFKSGCLYKSASADRGTKWRRGWTVLSRDGTLRFFSSPTATQADSVILLTDPDVTFSSPSDIDLPVSASIAPGQYPIIKLTTSQVAWLLCAESDDDRTAWQTMFDQMRTNFAQNLLFTNIPDISTENMRGSGRQVVYKIEDENKPYYIRFVDDQGRQQTITVRELEDQRQEREFDEFFMGFLGGLLMWPFCFPIWL